MAVPLTRDQQIFANELAKQTGLHPKVTAAWVVAEEGGANSSAAQQREKSGNHNWLNIGPGRTYATPQEGAAAAAQLLKSSGNYKGIRQAIAARSPKQELNAITTSPWDAGHYSGGKILHDLYHQVDGSAPSATATTTRATTSYLPAKTAPDMDAALLDALTSHHTHGDLLKSAIAGIASGAYDTTTPASTVTVAPHQRAGVDVAGHTRSAPVQGVGVFDGKKVAAWMIPDLQYARAHGWPGTVTSGYRSDAEQARIYQSGVRPAALPRSMGGSGSNHSRTGDGEGAVDVTHAAELSKILSANGSRLQWAGAKDPVHFSVPHNGSY